MEAGELWQDPLPCFLNQELKSCMWSVGSLLNMVRCWISELVSGLSLNWLNNAAHNWSQLTIELGANLLLVDAFPLRDKTSILNILSCDFMNVAEICNILDVIKRRNWAISIKKRKRLCGWFWKWIPLSLLQRSSGILGYKAMISASGYYVLGDIEMGIICRNEDSRF